MKSTNPQNRPFLDLESKYVKDYFKKIQDVTADVLKQDFTEVPAYKVPSKYEYGDWTFRVIKSPTDGLQLKNFYSDALKEIVLDENIPTVSLNTFAAKFENTFKPNVTVKIGNKEIESFIVDTTNKANVNPN